jgi:hypothetical protein
MSRRGEKMGRLDQHKRRKTEREKDQKRVVRVCTTGTPSIALLCMSVSVFSPFFSLLHLMPFGLRCRATTHILNILVAQWLERAETLSGSGRAELFFSSKFFPFHTDLLVRRWHTDAKANSINANTHTHTHA